MSERRREGRRVGYRREETGQEQGPRETEGKWELEGGGKTVRGRKKKKEVERCR